MPIPFDYHTHHFRCGHAIGEMDEYVQVAIDLGLTTFGVSDHCPMLFFAGDDPLPNTTMARSEVGDYVAEALALKEKYAGKINLKLGIEADFWPGWETAYAELLAQHPFDYVLGSVHWVAEVNIFKRDRWETDDAETVYATYYDLVAQAARTKLFDVMSHLTAVEAYGPPLRPEFAAQLYAPVAAALAESGMAAEINTSGYRKMNGDEPFPNRHMLRLLVEAGVPLTFGSDAHRPDEVGFARERVAALLAEFDIDINAPREIETKRGTIQAYCL